MAYFTRHVNFTLHRILRPSFHLDYPYLHRELIYYLCFFLKKRQTLHKAYYLLINLAIADLLVGIQMIISLGTQSVPFRFTDYNLLMFSLLILFSCSSLFSLADISLERVYAVVWPLRHRTVNYRVYFGSSAFIWAAGICAAVLFILSIGPFLRPIFTAVAINITILSSLCCLYKLRDHTMPVKTPFPRI